VLKSSWWWWWWWWWVLESKLSDQLWLSFSLALAKPNKIFKNKKMLRLVTFH
jgi:hypothetical protein